MRFDIITIFPEIFDSYFKESFLLKAQKKKIIKIKIHNLRRWAKDRHKSVDDKPFGGGLGMVLKIEPIYKAVQSLKPKTKNSPYGGSPAGRQKSKIILFTPRGKKFTQKMASKLSKLDQIIFICGRYEGVDERVAKKIADIELSIGDYVLMGGELPAMVAIETITRLIPGVVGKDKFLRERAKKQGFIEYAQYTRPEIFRARLAKGGKAKIIEWHVPKVLLSGNHKKIEEWRKNHGRIIE